MGLCLQCKKWVNQTPGKKAKKFCNDTCRSNYRYAQNKKKELPKTTEQKIYDSPKLPDNFTEDEPLSFERMKKQLPAQRGYDDFYRDLEEAEDLAGLERVGRQIEKSSLSWKDKNHLKAHGQAIAQKKFIY